MTDVATLIERRARHRLRTTAERQNDASAYIARHRQLRREIRIAQAKEIAVTLAEFAAVALFIGMALVWAGIVELPV